MASCCSYEAIAVSRPLLDCYIMRKLIVHFGSLDDALGSHKYVINMKNGAFAQPQNGLN